MIKNLYLNYSFTVEYGGTKRLTCYRFGTQANFATKVCIITLFFLC
jgi:hypothetical protein